jgi:hypothetical protein
MLEKTLRNNFGKHGLVNKNKLNYNITTYDEVGLKESMSTNQIIIPNLTQ